MDKYMRDRAAENGATLINGLMLSMKKPDQPDGSYVITYNDFGSQEGNARKGVKTTLEVDRSVKKRVHLTYPTLAATSRPTKSEKNPPIDRKSRGISQEFPRNFR